MQLVRVTWEEQTSIKELPPLDWSVGRSVHHFLDWLSIRLPIVDVISYIWHFTKVGATQEDPNLTEELPPSDWPVSMSVQHFLGWLSIVWWSLTAKESRLRKPTSSSTSWFPPLLLFEFLLYFFPWWAMIAMSKPNQPVLPWVAFCHGVHHSNRKQRNTEDNQFVCDSSSWHTVCNSV